MVLVLPSLPVPEITTASGAGLGCADSQTRNFLSNQRTFGTGRRHGRSTLISARGTLAGSVAISCGGVPKTVARRPAESDKPVAGPGVLAEGGSSIADCGAGGAGA